MAKYQFLSGGERPRKPVFQVVQGEQQLNIQKLHVTTTSVRPRKSVFQVGIGKESDGKHKEINGKAVGIANSSSIRRSSKRCYKIKTAKTSRTGCDYPIRVITREKG